jgi:D-lactate dehydrogenase
VVITRHIAFNTDGALKRILGTTISNIESFARGEPQNVVANPNSN